MSRAPPCSTLFPYTTLFRSEQQAVAEDELCHRPHVSDLDCTSPVEPCGGLSSTLQVDRSPRARSHDHSGKLARPDRKSTRLNSSHANISYAVFCLKKKKNYT